MTNKKQKIFFTQRLFIVLISRRLRQMNTDDFLWGHGDKYYAHGCYFRTRINRIERIFHPVHISKWRQNHVLAEACRICHKWRILSCRTIWLFIQMCCLFMHLCRSFIHIAYWEKLNRLFGLANQTIWIC